MKPVLRVIAFLFLVGLLFQILQPGTRPTVVNNPIRVLDVAADPDVAGKVYVLTGKNIAYYCSAAPITRCIQSVSPEQEIKVHESGDYGKTWKEIPVEIVVDGNTHIKQFKVRPNFDLRIYEDAYGRFHCNDSDYGTELRCFKWKSAYGIIRKKDSSYSYMSNYYDNPIPNSISNADRSTVFIGLGVSGIVVGPNPAYSATPTRDWMLVNSILPPSVSSSSLGFTAFPLILITLTIMLLIPPLPYLNGWALMQAFRYAFQPGEDRELRRYTWLITGIATLSYLVPLTFAITRQDVDFKAAIIILGIFNVIIGALGGWWISRKRNFSTAFTRKMIIGCILLSLPVPIGLYFGIVAWCILMALWCAFVGCRAALSQFLEKEGGVGAQWGIDRMALEIPGLFLIIVVPMMTLALGLWYGLMFLRLDALFAIIYPLVALAVVVAIFVNVVIRYLKLRVRRGAWLVKKKAAQPDGANGLRRSDRSLWRKLFDYTLIWVSGTVTVCLCLIWAVTTAPAWFQMLMGF